LLIQSLWTGATQVQTVAYSEFERLLAEGQASGVTVSEGSLRAHLKAPLPGGPSEMSTIRVDPALAERLREHGVATVAGAPPPAMLSSVLSWLVPMVLFYFA